MLAVPEPAGAVVALIAFCLFVGSPKRPNLLRGKS
jgi:hypothetical protein